MRPENWCKVSFLRVQQRKRFVGVWNQHTLDHYFSALTTCSSLLWNPLILVSTLFLSIVLNVVNIWAFWLTKNCNFATTSALFNQSKSFRAVGIKDKLKCFMPDNILKANLYSFMYVFCMDWLYGVGSRAPFKSFLYRHIKFSKSGLENEQ